MSIDPNTLPDGTVVEMDNGRLRFKDGDGRQPSRGYLGDGRPFPWGDRAIVRTYTPDPTPDQEVPRDEWANIAVGSRVRIVEVDGDEHTVKVDYVSPAADVVWLYDEDHDYDGAKIARVYLLDAPTPPDPSDPDAEAVEVMARTEEPRVRIHTGTSGHAVVRLDGLTCEDIEAALADVGAWVEVDDWGAVKEGARLRNEWVRGRAGGRTYVHRDDLPPTDPDAELVEKMARAMCDEFHEGGWGRALPNTREKFSRRARAALAVVREHEAKS